MTAYLYAYGKQKNLHYGTALIAPALLPVQQELEALSGYQGHRSGEQSLRHGYLSNGMEYLSFAYALPNGGSQDQRGQIEVYTLAFQKSDSFVLTHATLFALAALQRADFATLVRREISEIDLEDMLALSSPEPFFSEVPTALVQAILATLLYQGAKGGHPYLLARCRPRELLSALAVLPAWLRDAVSFNTDVQSLADEPLGTINAWTEAAWQNAERTNFHGASYSAARFLYPGEDGVTFSANGAEILAARFLRMTRQEQEQAAKDAGYDLHALYRLLHRQELEEKRQRSLSVKSVPPKRKRRTRHVIMPFLLSGFVFLAGFLLLFVTDFWLPNSNTCFFQLQITEDTVLFTSAIVLGYVLSWGSSRLLPPLVRPSIPREATRVRIPLFWMVAYGMILLLLCFAGQGQTTLSYGQGVCSLQLWLGGTPDRLICGNLIGMILWGVKQLRERLEEKHHAS